MALWLFPLASPTGALFLPDCTHELCPSTMLGTCRHHGKQADEIRSSLETLDLLGDQKYDPDAPSPVFCDVQLAELAPEYFSTLGTWQKRYGRDNLQLSRHFLQEIFHAQIEPQLEEALNHCPAAVLEIMMNCLLAVETEQGRTAARDFLLQIHRLRDELLEKLPDDQRKKQLHQLMLEWNADIAYVYPKFLDLQSLGPEADWFYVPLHATCVYVKLNENVSEELVFNMDNVSNHFIWDPMMDFLKASRYFHRYEGADHIFLFADGQGPRIWDSYDLLRSESVFLSPESRCPTWNEPLRRYVDVKRCLSSWKDLVIPGHTDYARIQYMKSHNKRSAERRLLMTFHGRAPELHGAYSHCAARGALMQLGRARGLDEGVDIGGFVGDYPERKGDSHFCLVPAGTSPWTNHLYESFYAGCIPVILSDEYEVAFADDLPWHKFSIKWPESQVCDDADCTSSTLYNYLRDFAQEHPQQLWEMKRELEIHSCYFNWYSTDQSCSPYFLLHKHLKHLADQRSRRKSREPRYWNAAPAFVGRDPAFVHLERETRFKHFDDDSWALVVGNEERGVRSPCAGGLFGGRWLILKTVCVQDAFVEELELVDECLRYKLLAGNGPESGWVNIKLDQTDLLHCIVKEAADDTTSQVPFFCAWYSGGFSPKDGEKLLAPLLDAVKEAGMKDAAIFHFPDAYGIAEEGREPWAKYIDLLVEEVNQVAGENRPLVLFGHSRGAAPATCLAYRLQKRVKKVYIAACGAMHLGEPTGWELLSQRFKAGGDRDLLKWFSDLQPENILLRRTAYDTSDSEFQEQVQSSKFLSEMLNLMRAQYRDAMYPDPERDFGSMPVPIMAFSPLLDDSCQPEHCKAWGRLTEDFQLENLNAGHMDCLQARAAPLPPDLKLELHCPLLIPEILQMTPAMEETLRNFAQVQANQRGEGTSCELFEKISQDLQQFLA
ncbi:4-xylosyltransferase IRX10L (Glucuronoxylan glucuronosyltransferase 1) (AtGUT1) (Glucuronoxylan glucuronosyltransferase 2) (AtGUT2) (Protein IRREGULAR XYLEM 10-like) (Xylan xylosyltransferase IRX10L) [Durusdinium trenchii]|uniref:4-xylosyltransferase IRX10L (Glucuronoxylan glucuronosyltransferase 1) (AtGUT1) (Glucuronoxylan glucuronosyltransferase 2) (AtGUT2) (Protein IRREGULAR XYLEM 10-like) (Xylan xylosyltransferase IRX10L) n=1 Tax=Durusdinium trenchii TaxID=1381693 RepID=A0ABP0M5I9_9DINO